MPGRRWRTLTAAFAAIVLLIPAVISQVDPTVTYQPKEDGASKDVGKVKDMTWSPDGAHLVTVTDDMFSLFWDYPEGSNYQRYYTTGEVIISGSTDHVDVSHDGKYIVTMLNYFDNLNSYVTKFDVYRSDSIDSNDHPEYYNRNDAYHHGLCFSPISSNLFASSRELDEQTSVVEIYRISGELEIELVDEFTIPGRVYGELDWSHDGQYIALPLRDDDGVRLSIIQASSGAEFYSDDVNYQKDITDLQWSPEDNYLAVVASQKNGRGVFAVYDFTSESYHITMDSQETSLHDKPVTCVSWSGEGVVATGDRAGIIRTFAHITDAEGKDDGWYPWITLDTGAAVASIAHHPQEDVLAVYHSGSAVSLYDLVESSDGSGAPSGGTDDGGVLFDTGSGEGEEWDIEKHSEGVSVDDLQSVCLSILATMIGTIFLVLLLVLVGVILAVRAAQQ